MSDREEERSFSIGSAVWFTHQGETIRGHLLQRQGRRRFAKVIDAEERAWNVPEQVLKDSGEARLSHDDDAARRSTSRLPPGRRGDVRRHRPTEARRDREAQPQEREGCAAERHTGKSPTACSAVAGEKGKRNGAVRLNGVAEMARRLIDEHGLIGWTLAFVEAERRLGDCDFKGRVIRISRSHALEGSDEQIRDTVLHEIAHAIAGQEAGHGPMWKATARRIGATPRANVYESQTN